MVKGFWFEFADAWADNEIAGVPGTITFIVWPFYLLLVVGGAATGIEFLLRFIGEIGGTARALRQKSDDDKRISRGYGWLIALGAFAVIIYLMTSAELSNAQIGVLSILCMLVLI